jgi:hypothetical protein
MIVIIFVVLFVISGVLAWRSLADLRTPQNSGPRIARQSKKGLFGVINLPSRQAGLPTKKG